jgi:hypothetical protein
VAVADDVGRSRGKHGRLDRLVSPLLRAAVSQQGGNRSSAILRVVDLPTRDLDDTELQSADVCLPDPDPYLD